MNKEFFSPHYSHYYPDLTIAGGDGLYAFGDDGQRYIDASSQWGVLALGYGHPKIRAVMHRVIDEGLAHVSAGNYNHKYQHPLMEALVKRMPTDHEWRVSLAANSGAEAIEKALKLARYHTGKPGFISLLGSFHGRTTGATSLGTAALLQQHKFGGFLPNIYHTSVDDQRGLGILEKMFYPARERVAAFFVEPVQGVGGCNAVTPEMMRAIRDFCTRNHVLMVADEVQSGFGRTGKFWAFEHSGIAPDIVCVAKPMGGGVPSGAVIAKKEIMTWSAGADGSTFGGNPMACAAGLAVLEIINDDFLKAVEKNSQWFRQNLQSHLDQILHPQNQQWQVQGLGLMLAINCPDKDFRNEVMKRAYKKKLLLATAEPTAIRLLPPLNTPGWALADIISILDESFRVPH